MLSTIYCIIITCKTDQLLLLMNVVQNPFGRNLLHVLSVSSCSEVTTTYQNVVGRKPFSEPLSPAVYTSNYRRSTDRTNLSSLSDIFIAHVLKISSQADNSKISLRWLALRTAPGGYVCSYRGATRIGIPKGRHEVGYPSQQPQDTINPSWSVFHASVKRTA